MEIRFPRGTVSTMVSALALFLAPNVLGLLAGVFTRLLSSFAAWWPPDSLQPLPIGVTVLVLVVVAYSLATLRGGVLGERAAQGPKPTERRRFLPPIELVLLQIGNVTFLAFALILVVVALGLAVSALQALLAHPGFLANGFVACLGLAAAVMLLTLRPSVLTALDWNRLSRTWTRRSVLLAIAVAAFGVVGAVQSSGPVRLQLSESQLSLQLMAAIYLALMVCLALGHLLARRGRPTAPDEASLPVPRWSTPPLVLSWIANLGMLALYLNGVLLTLHGHLVPT
jgi:MFS family permease